MKNLGLIILTAASSAIFASCSGDHGTNGGKDTASTTAIGNYDVRTNIDTSKSTNSMGDATILDNTASGGVLVAKDTSHMKVRSVAITPSVPVLAAPVKDSTAAATAKK